MCQNAYIRIIAYMTIQPGTVEYKRKTAPWAVYEKGFIQT
jgi:hypothetical protein